MFLSTNKTLRILGNGVIALVYTVPDLSEDSNRRNFLKFSEAMHARSVSMQECAGFARERIPFVPIDSAWRNELTILSHNGV